ncbi:YdcF family protein [Sphingomonas sp.]|uniref:YdcF family protein n=1 Tax=Sphingomonas sp. TaxID=28214 RepID=UPI003B00BDA1
MFGAAVRPDGRPSETLARRVGYAAAAAEADPGADLFCSGAKGRFGPAEAEVMGEMLAGAVAGARLHLDRESRDTLETVRAAARFFRAGGYDRLLVATDNYHDPRVRMLFALDGIHSRRIPFALRGRRRLLWKMRAREAAALPYDLIAGLAARWRDRHR